MNLSPRRMLLAAAWYLVLPSCLLAQNFLNPANRWYVAISGFPDPDPVYARISLGGDTLVDGRTYTRVLSARDSLGATARATGELLRVEGQRVFSRMIGGPERLLFDFGARVGDTLTIAPEVVGDPTCELVVESVDSVALADGSLRRRVSLTGTAASGAAPTAWIEGIGGTDGPTAELQVGCRLDSGSELACFLAEGAAVDYPVGATACFASGADLLVPGLDVQAYPSPFATHIELVAADARVAAFTLRDARGRAVRSGRLLAQRATVATDDLPSGTYVVEWLGRRAEVLAATRVLKR